MRWKKCQRCVGVGEGAIIAGHAYELLHGFAKGVEASYIRNWAFKFRVEKHILIEQLFSRSAVPAGLNPTLTILKVAKLGGSFSPCSRCPCGIT